MYCAEGDDNMKNTTAFDDMPVEAMFYGALFALTNRIQTIGDGVFHDITIRQHFILMTIRIFDCNSPTLKDVADIVGCSYQNIKRMAVVLENKGYLTMERDTEDKRKFKLILTDRVNSVSSEMDEVIDKFLGILYKDLSKEDLLNALAVLKKLDQNLLSM